ncbi:hypothetical protein Mapa_006793 [Marchantia paleacea]|nr:hypothetical protein Mapa_006793 [Marchantia paleacea]
MTRSDLFDQIYNAACKELLRGYCPLRGAGYGPLDGFSSSILLLSLVQQGICLAKC